MNSPPKTLLKSRAQLQAIHADSSHLVKYESFDIVLSYVWVRVKALLQGNNTNTQYIINFYDLERHMGRLVSIEFSTAYITELMEVLRREYPGVDFTYRETAGYEGNVLERILIMDWS
jgi:hypothetical protein